MATSIGESSPEVITTFMQQVVTEYRDYGVGFRRSEPREAVAIPVVIQPVNASLEAIGEPVSAVTRDISSGGIGIFYTQPMSPGWLKITLSTPETHSHMTLLARIEHCTPCGGFYIIGCRFARALASEDAEDE
jgi:hypothetical protein